MDPKQTALATVAIVGGIGLLAVSCSDSDDNGEHGHGAKVEHHAQAEGHGAKSGGHQELHWGYEGKMAPEAWASLDKAYATCGSGKEQSPIDLSAVTLGELPEIEFHYQPTPMDVVNNGHTIQVNYEPGSYISVEGKKYDLLQFHFHSPSEHTVAGKPYDMVAHLVHKAADGQLGVVAVMFEEGGGINNAIAEIWRNIPAETGHPHAAEGMTVNAADLLPGNLSYFNYSGSLTTPPCSEGVNWMVLAAPNYIAPAQVDEFTALFPKSTRPVQALNDRTVRLDF